MDNAEIVKKAKKGDDAAFSKLYESVYKDMYRYAYYIMGNQSDAEDVVSDTVLDAYRTIKNLRDESKFRNWIFTILSNKCKKLKINNYNNGVELDEKIPDKNQNEKLDLKHDVDEAFKVLNEEEKTVVSLAVFAGYKSKEIGSLLKLKPVTVRSKLSRALEKMRGRMEAWENEYE